MAATDVLTFNLVEHLLPGQRDLIDTFMAHDQALSTGAKGGTETLTGATGLIIADITKAQSLLSITGAQAFTLPDGTYTGQTHEFICTVASTIPVGALTITTPETTAGLACASTFVFTVVGQAATFRWSGTKWQCVAKKRSGTLQVTPGTTVLTGYSMSINYQLTVDGTAAGTGTGGLPNGSVIGEQCVISQKTATNIPAGSLTGVYKDLIGTAATICGAFGVIASASVVGDIWLGTWDGAAWQTTYQAGVTLS